MFERTWNFTANDMKAQKINDENLYLIKSNLDL